MASVMPASSTGPAPANTSRPSTHPYSCNSCQVAFRSPEQQRAHMHTDWHRYNLKRRITSLPPLASEVFAEKVLHIQATNKLEQEKATFQKECRTCNKTYFSENAYMNHVNSSKHRQNVTAEELGIKARPVENTNDETQSVISSTFSLGQPVGEDEAGTAHKVAAVREETDAEMNKENATDKEFANEIAELSLSTSRKEETEKIEKKEDATVAEDEKEPEPLPIEQCLFCNYMSPTLQLNVSHMSKAHGLFIPEQKYLVDLEGFVEYLGEKLVILNECLYCGKTKGGLEGVQTHMRDVGHCKIAFETEDQQLELGEFYDFRASYDYGTDDEDEDFDPNASVSKKRSGIKSNSQKGKSEFKTETGEDAVEGEDAGWETDSSASSLDSTELCAVPLDHTHSQEGHHPRHRKEDGYHSHAHSRAHTTAVYHTEYELHLPSGRTAGHRSLNRYYRQNLSHPLSERIARDAVSHTRHPGRGSNAEDDDAENDSDNENQDTGVNRELTRRERRDLFFGRMGEEERAELVGTRHERGLTTRGEAGMVGVSAAKRKEVAAAERRGRVMEARERRKVGWRIDRTGNSQKHYRDPLLQ